mmetsp:Transcript_94259/g.224415  ORF Transcript_94259/g.224415 Transcript_94259/m.224415 type:complete len:259 (+) Transcript_94259:3690-4466(+)
MVVGLPADQEIAAANPQAVHLIHDAGVVSGAVHLLHQNGHGHKRRHVLILHLAVAQATKPPSAESQQSPILGDQRGVLGPAGHAAQHPQLRLRDHHPLGGKLLAVGEAGAKAQAPPGGVAPGEALPAFDQASRMLLSRCHAQHVSGICDELRSVSCLHGASAQLALAAVAPRVHQGVRRHDDAVLEAHGDHPHRPAPHTGFQRYRQPAVPSSIQRRHQAVVLQRLQLGDVSHMGNLALAPEPQVLHRHATRRHLPAAC